MPWLRSNLRFLSAFSSGFGAEIRRTGAIFSSVGADRASLGVVFHLLRAIARLKRAY
jgi:hypothetical protein